LNFFNSCNLAAEQPSDTFAHTIYISIDHDYGCNNADRTFEFKHESSLAFLDFIGAPNDSAMRLRAQQGHGVYGVKLFDFNRLDRDYEVPDVQAGIDADLANDNSFYNTPFSHQSNRTVAVFVLDVRTSKTPWKTGPASYLPDYEGDFLGEVQWEWFEKSIRRSRASVNVIVSGLQYHGNRYQDANIAEAWGKVPTAQQRLFDAILQENVQAPVLISGDVHMTQLSRKDCVRRQDDTTSSSSTRHDSRRRPLVELTTSGMTHSWGTISTPLGSDNFQPTWYNWIQSHLARNLVHLLHRYCPWTDIMIAPKSSAPSSSSSLYENGGGEGSKGGMQYSLDMNFGELEFDWDERTVAIRSIGENGMEEPPLIMAKMSMDQLSGDSDLPNQHMVSESDFTTMEHESVSQGEWICINHRGIDRPFDHVMGHLTAATVWISFCIAPLVLVGWLILIVLRRMSVEKKSSRSLARKNTMDFFLHLRY
jgi:PhoD-like phosphatase